MPHTPNTVTSVLRRARTTVGQLNDTLQRRVGRRSDGAVRPVKLPDLNALFPFVGKDFHRESDQLHLTVSGENVSISDGHLVRASGSITSRLTIEILTPQHHAEPTVPGSSTDPNRHLVSAEHTRLVVDLRPNDFVPLSLEGILGVLQTHVLAHDSRLNLPARVLLEPKNLVIADDVPIEPADAASATFRERWHFALRSLTYPHPHQPVRSDATAWRVRENGVPGHGFDTRPSSAEPAVGDLHNLVVQTGPGKAPARSPLVGQSLLLSGGGASGELNGAWSGATVPLTLYRERFVTGRTTSGVIANEGMLYPFGLRVSEVTSWQRELAHSDVDKADGAFLVKSTKIVFRETSRNLKAGDDSNPRSPFVYVEVMNPVRDGVANPEAPHDTFGHPVPLISYLVRDRAGVTHRLDVPGYFLQLPGPTQLTEAAQAIERLREMYAPATGEKAADLDASSSSLSRAFLGAHGAQVTYRPGAGDAATLFTHELRFRLPASTPDAVLDWHGDNRPDLEVDWFLTELSQVAQFTGSPKTVMARYSAPGSPALLEPVEPVRVDLKSAVGSGAFGTPSFQITAFTAQGAVYLPGTKAASSVESLFPASGGPRVLGLFELRKIIEDAGVSLASPSIGQQDGQHALHYSTSLGKVKQKSTTFLPLTLDTPEGVSSFALDTTVGKSSTSTSTITNLAVGLGGLIEVRIPSCSVTQDATGLHVVADIKPPRLVGPFSLVQEILDHLPANLFGDGPTVVLTNDGIVAQVIIDLPSVAFGVFAVRNLTLQVTVTFLLGGGGVVAEVSLGSPTRPFQVGAGIFVGGGFLALAIRTDGTTVTPRISGALELGAGVSIDLALASGVVEAVAGLAITAEQDPDTKDWTIKAGGYVRVLGSIRVKYIGSMTMRALVGLEYDGHKTVTGHASVTVEIDVFFLSTSFSVSFSYSFHTNNSDPPLLVLLASARGAEAEWDDYWAAFGAIEGAGQ